jgi:hypothetical protein
MRAISEASLANGATHNGRANDTGFSAGITDALARTSWSEASSLLLEMRKRRKVPKVWQLTIFCYHIIVILVEINITEGLFQVILN